MKTSNFESWELIKDLPNDLYFYGLEDTSDSLIILLKSINEGRILKLIFEGVLTYRVTKEAGRSKTLYENKSLRGFQIATKSEYLQWFKEESSGMFEDDDLRHYYICNTDNILDIVSGPPVDVKWINL